MSDYQMQEVRVSQIETITAQVKRFTLTAISGSRCPRFRVAVILSCRCAMVRIRTAMHTR